MTTIFEISHQDHITPLTIDIVQELGFIGKYKSCGYLFRKDGFEIINQDEDDEGNSIPDYILHFYHEHHGEAIYTVGQIKARYNQFIEKQEKP